MKPFWEKILAKIVEWWWPKTIEGDHCPMCGKWTKRHRRYLSRGMVCGLLALRERSRALNNGDIYGWVDLRKCTIPVDLQTWFHHCELEKVLWWKLVATQEKVLDTDEEPDGHGSGFWRLTPKGNAFLNGKRKERAYRVVVHSTPYYRSKRFVTVDEAFAEKFDYAKLMAGGGPLTWPTKKPKKPKKPKK